MAQYVVIGLGNFGSNLAVSLSKRGHEVLAIDSSAARVQEVKDQVTNAVIADAADRVVLAEFVRKDADAVIVSLGDKIESSCLVTFYLKEFGVRNIIVKVVNEVQGEIIKRVGATDIINPEKDTALHLAKRLGIPNLIDHIPLAPEYSLVELAVSDELVGKTLKQLDLRTRYKVEVIAVKDVLHDTITLIPEPDIELKPDSVLIVLGKEENLTKLKF